MVDTLLRGNPLWFIYIMGNIIRRNTDLDELDSSSDEEIVDQFEEEMEERSVTPDSNLNCDLQLETTDALDAETSIMRSPTLNVLKFAALIEIVSSLDDYEKVSVLFLVNDNVDDCLNNIKIYDWAKKDHNWQGKIIEALCIIQNYQVLKKHGLLKSSLLKEFFPHSYFTSKYINVFRKKLYYLFENLSKKQEEEFLKHVALDFVRLNLTFVRFEYLEMYFSYFLKIGYISQVNTKNCALIIKSMELDYLYDIIKTTDRVLRNSSNNDDDNHVDESTLSTLELASVESGATRDNVQRIDDQSSLNTPTEGRSLQTEDDVYPTKRDRICLIIDQENFYTEMDERYRHLTPQELVRRKIKMQSRTGTKNDSDRLKKSFEDRLFQVTVERNLTHLKVVEKLKQAVDVIDEKNCMCFFVCILTHGDEGIIYGCNSCLVEISTIIDTMCHKKLIKVPKVLVIQSCQGVAFQTEYLSGDLEHDGPVLKYKPNIKDRHFMIFWSTVPGYISVRNKKDGTWFIQTLCNQLDEADDSTHFLDICTRTKGKIENLKYEASNQKYIMVPLVETTFTKNLFLKRS